MAVAPEELRLAAFAMFTAFAAMGAFGFSPSFRARRAHPRSVRADRKIPKGVETGWVSVPIAVVVALLGALALPSWVAASPISLLGYSGPALLAAGVGTFAAGALVAGWAARHLGEQLTVAIEVREGGALITTGPYRFVRHPIYTGIFLMAGGAAFALASPLMVVELGVAIVCGTIRAVVEEDLLASDAALGPSYRAYKLSTGRFLPPGGRKRISHPSDRTP